jgi:hypothetical protein
MRHIANLTLWALCLTGCGDTLALRYNQAVATAAIMAGGCRDTLSDASEHQVAACGDILKTGNKAGAQVCLDKWRALHDKIGEVCKAAKIGAKAAFDAGPVIEAAATKKTDMLGWIARLVALGADVVKALGEAGLKLPGGAP